MSLHPFPAEVRASAKIRAKRDTAITCRERASMDLLKSVSMMTANERMILERSAANWTQRALLLDRVDEVASARADLVSKGLRA